LPALRCLWSALSAESVDCGLCLPDNTEKAPLVAPCDSLGLLGPSACEQLTAARLTKMGDFCVRMKSALTGDSGDLNPKLRPPPLLGVLFCLISTFCFICIMVSFRLGPVTFLLCLGLCVLFGAVGTGEGSAWEREYPSTRLLVPLGVGSALIPMYIGVKIYVVLYSPYYLAVSGRSYKDVGPVAKSAMYADAGIIQFTTDAALDTSRSFGLKGEDFTYCVAPVVSRSASVHPESAGPKVSFWAVGKDCCGNRRDFECDGAGETETRNAFTVGEMEKDALTKILVPTSSRPQYLKAVEAAKALHNLQSEDESNVILVRWAADPDRILQVWHDRAKIAVVVACVLHAIIITFLWTGIHVYFDSDIKKLAKTRNFAGAARGARPVNDPFMVGGSV